MKVFITGASGFIGSAVAAAFARAGHDVCGLVHTPAKAPVLAAREVVPVVGSMEEPRSYEERAASAEILVHCAAEYSARRYAELDKLTAETLMAAANKAQAPRLFLYTSGVWVYGDTGEGKVDEASPLNPAVVAKQRTLHERLVLEGDRGLLRTLVIRPGCVYGGSGSLTADWFESAERNAAARVVGDGANRWAMIHVEDLADLYLRAAESAHRAQIFNAVDRSRFSVQDCARAASRAAGAGGKVQNLTPEAAREAFGAMAEPLAFTQHVDSSKAVRLLGWQPRHGGFVDGVSRYYTAWKALQPS
jgi:nucleoside-diphosphate-sugar epimerase